MCKDCVVTRFIDRGDVVHESGSYLLNFKKCAQCQARFMIKIQNKVVDGDENVDDEVEITFDHHCSKCNHKICQHFYSYQLDDGYHKYLMQCELCGQGAYEQFAGIKKMDVNGNLVDVNINDNNDNDNNDDNKINNNNNDNKDNIHNNNDNNDNSDDNNDDKQKDDKQNKKIVIDFSKMNQINIDKVNDDNNDVQDDDWDSSDD